MYEYLIAHLRSTRASKLAEIEKARRDKYKLKNPDRNLDDADSVRHLVQEVDGVLAAQFCKSMKELLANCISHVFFSALCGHLKADRNPPILMSDVGKELGVSGSNHTSRWGVTTIPSANKFFLAILKWRVDVRRITNTWSGTAGAWIFNTNHFREVELQGVAHTLEQIRVREDKRAKFEELSIQELVSIRTVVDDGTAGSLLPRTAEADKAAKDIAKKYPDIPIKDPTVLSDLLRRWLLSYRLYEAASLNMENFRAH
jgi:hypothetical protein